MSGFTVRELPGNAGVEIGEIDLRVAAEKQRAGLRALLDERQILLFRGQSLAEDDQIAVLGTFGKVCDEFEVGRYASLVSNVRPDGRTGDWPLPFHSDFAFAPYQPPVLSLYGLELDGRAVPTTFVNCMRACALLPPELRSRLEGKAAVHAVDLSLNNAAAGYARRLRLLDMPADRAARIATRSTFPILRPHPRTGAPVLFVSEMFTSHVEGLAGAQSEELLEALFRCMYAAENLWTHEWSRGDLIVWDNVAVQHGRRGGGSTESETRRTLRRVVVSEKGVRELKSGAA